MVAPETVYPPEPVAEGPFVPYHSADEDPVFCWEGCHGFIIGPLGTRLCVCPQPQPVSPAFVAMRDALAEIYRRRWFKVLRPSLDGATENEARVAWDGLWVAAQQRAAHRLAERGLR